MCTSCPSFKTLRVAWGMLFFFYALTLQFGFKNAEETFHAVSSEVPSFLDSSTLKVICGSGFLSCVLSVALQVHLKHFSGPQVPFLFAAMSGSMSISWFCHIPLSSACCRDVPWLLHHLPAWLLGHPAASSPPASCSPPDFLSLVLRRDSRKPSPKGDTCSSLEKLFCQSRKKCLAALSSL